MTNLVLVHKATREPVQIGETVTSFRGEKARVTGWMEPRHSGSTGRIYVSDHGSTDIFDAAGFYPSVFNCVWEQRR